MDNKIQITFYDIQVKDDEDWIFLKCDLDLTDLKDEMKAIACVEDAPLRIVKIVEVLDLENRKLLTKEVIPI
jgi:hypothetical protein